MQLPLTVLATDSADMVEQWIGEWIGGLLVRNDDGIVQY